MSQSIIMYSLETKFLLIHFTRRASAGAAGKREKYPSLEKRGQGRFSEEYVFLIMDSEVSGRL
jgi:hypothetical protein